MSVSAQKTLLTALKSQRFDVSYYIAGEDTFQQEAAVRQLIQSATDAATRDFNYDLRNAAELNAAALDGLLRTPPMMAARRVIVVRDVHQLKREARKRLDRYLEGPSPDVLLLLLGNAETKVDSALSKATTPLIFEFLTADRIPRWISHYAKESLSAEITPDAVRLLHQAVGEDLQQLATELDKLASYTAGGEIDEEAVTAIVGVRTGELVGPFLDAVGAKDSARALRLVPAVLSQPKMSAVTIVMTLATQFLALAWSRARLDSGLSRSRLASELFNLLKRNSSAYTGRPWTEAVNAWVSQIELWERGDLDRVLTVLLEADIALKETRLSTDEQLVAGLVLRICGERSRQAAA